MVCYISNLVKFIQTVIECTEYKNKITNYSNSF